MNNESKSKLTSVKRYLVDFIALFIFAITLNYIRKYIIFLYHSSIQHDAVFSDYIFLIILPCINFILTIAVSYYYINSKPPKSLRSYEKTFILCKTYIIINIITFTISAIIALIFALMVFPY